MKYKDIKGKYFIVVEGEERAIIRDSEEQAEKMRKRLAKYSGGRRIYVYKSERKSE